MRTLLHTPTNDLKQSLDFYTRLQFRILSPDDPVLVTDGKALIEINPDRYARAGIKLFRSSWEVVVEALRPAVQVIKTDFGYLLSDPSAVWIYLVEDELDFSFHPSDIPFSVLGNFAGLSLESTDMERSAAVWEAIGFFPAQGETDQGWIMLENADQLAVSIMKPFACPHLFFNPSLTYFNGKENNPKIIQRIREAGVPITEEITVFNPEGIVDNVILRDPGGYGFFVFNDQRRRFPRRTCNG